MSESKSWGEAHRREARRLLRQLAARYDIDTLAVEAVDACQTEASCAASLAALGPIGAARQMRRVRALAEGRLVREAPIKGYRIAHPNGDRSNIVTRQQARDGIDPMRKGEPDPHGRRVVPVHVTRIRRAP